MMKRIFYAVLATLSGLVLIFSYRTSLQPVAPVADASSSSSSSQTSSTTGTTGSPAPRSTATTAPSPSAGSTSSSAAAGAASAGLSDGTFVGTAAQSRYGAVQVQVTVSGGVVTDVQVPAYPDSNGRDRQINQSAIPRLVSETLQSQSASIDMVSGATYTSQGYRTSLQNALDQARG